MCLSKGTNITVQPLMMNPGISSSPTDLDGLRRLIALTTSESVTGAKGKNSEDDKRAGKSAGHGLLYTD
jgi:hypothetical protein